MTLPSTALDRAAAIVEIQQLKARYAEHADAKYGDDFQRAAPDDLMAAARAQADCFTEDARWAGGADFGGDIVGREALARFFATPPWNHATHLYGSPVIDVDGDTARARWRLWQVGVPAGETAPVLLSAHTEEQYRRTSEGWLHDHVRFVRIDRVVGGPDGLRIEGILR
jgi:hypothetical protein